MVKISRLMGGILLLGTLATAATPPQGDGKGASDAAVQANNPLANMTSLSLQDYYMGDVSGTDDTINQGWLRVAKPFSIAGTEWIMRASLPVYTSPTPDTGIGDFNFFAAGLIDTGIPELSFGIGPQLTAPTASEDALGSGKWSAGLANVLFDASSRIFQYGYLLTWQASFAGDSDRDNVNEGAFQPFAFLQLAHGTYLRMAPIWAYNFENDDYNIPLGLGIGQVLKKGKTVYNFFVEPQVSVAHEGAGQALWQVLAGLNVQLME